MKKNTETAKIPMINQVLKDAALGHLAECGLPQSLISGVDCSSYERMEETLLEVKNCFYSSVRKNIEDTYGPSCRVYTPDDEYKHLMEYKERDYWKNVRQHGLPHRKQQVYCKPLLHHRRPCKAG